MLTFPHRAHHHNIYGGPLSKVEMQEDTETQVSKLDVVLWYTLEVSTPALSTRCSRSALSLHLLLANVCSIFCSCGVSFSVVQHVSFTYEIYIFTMISCFTMVHRISARFLQQVICMIWGLDLAVPNMDVMDLPIGLNYLFQSSDLIIWIGV